MEENIQEEGEVKLSPVLSGNHVFDSIGPWLRNLHFRRQLFGGVNEADVWKKIEELNAKYEAALTAERARYNTLLRLLSEKAGEED